MKHIKSLSKARLPQKASTERLVRLSKEDKKGPSTNVMSL
jgi:hypothetical protein